MTVKDVTIRADEEGIWGEWDGKTTSAEQHRVIVSSPTTSPPQREPPKQLTFTTATNGFHIPIHELAHYSFIDLTIGMYGRDGELFNVSVSLEQKAGNQQNHNFIIIIVQEMYPCLLV